MYVYVRVLLSTAVVNIEKSVTGLAEILNRTICKTLGTRSPISVLVEVAYLTIDRLLYLSYV